MMCSESTASLLGDDVVTQSFSKQQVKNSNNSFLSQPISVRSKILSVSKEATVLAVLQTAQMLKTEIMCA